MSELRKAAATVRRLGSPFSAVADLMCEQADENERLRKIEAAVMPLFGYFPAASDVTVKQEKWNEIYGALNASVEGDSNDG